MVQLVVFINLFFVPMLPIYVLYRKMQKPLKPNLDLLFQYGIVAACNIPLAKIFIFSITMLSGTVISIDSGYYTVAALFPTILTISFYKLYKTYPDYAPWKEKIIQKGISGVAKDLAPACILLFVSCFMLLIFEPILMYATNINDFWFDFQIMIWPVLRIFVRYFLIGIVVILVIYNTDLLVSKRVIFYKGITLIGFIVFFLSYLQGNWLAGNLPTLTGTEIVWENYGENENVILTAAVVILILAVIGSIKKCGLNRTCFYTATCVSVVFIMLFVSLVPSVMANKALKSKDSFSPSLDNYDTASSNKNFLIFLVDAVDSKTCYEVMMKDDDFREMMEDFTYYPDTLSVFPYTNDSIPNILAGTVNHAKTDFADYSSGAYNHSPLFTKLAQNDYRINLYDNLAMIWEGKRSFNVENATSIYDISIDLDDFTEQELKYIKFKYLPYGLKQFSDIETLDFNSCRIMNVESGPALESKTESESNGYSWGNWVNYGRITENRILDKQSQNYFQFIHCEGSHHPFNMDKDLNYVEAGGTYDQKVAASLTMIKAYLQRLKDNDAYDNSVIVIMADHGVTLEFDAKQQPYYGLGYSNPILFIKGMDEKHEMIISDCSVSFADLQDAFSDLIDGKQSTELFAELKPGRTRTVLVNWTEYETTGKAWEIEKFTPTGNSYRYNK